MMNHNNLDHNVNRRKPRMRIHNAKNKTENQAAAQTTHIVKVKYRRLHLMMLEFFSSRPYEAWGRKQTPKRPNDNVLHEK